MAGANKKEQPGLMGWIEYRLPIFSFMKAQGDYRAPRNLNYGWSLGSILGIALVIQIVTGIVLAMHYTPHVDHAFDSVERIMRDVPFGWLIRYSHAVGASMFFAAVYLHIIRGLFYGSYKKPREILWFFGIFIFLAMMATAFMGYVLPWGQMSYWGATVITGLFSAIPLIGEEIQIWLLGGFSVDNPALNRFFSLHYLMPFVIFGLVFVHLWALHEHGSNNPTGVEVKTKKDSIPFHPYYTLKDFFGYGIFLLIFAAFVFYSPNYLGHPDNYIPADPLVTPAHIVPEWYFLPFYAMLRAVVFNITIFHAAAVLAVALLGWVYFEVNRPKKEVKMLRVLPAVASAGMVSLVVIAGLLYGMNDAIFGVTLIPAKLGGVIVMFGSILILFGLPWLDSSPVRSGRYRPVFKLCFIIFVINGVMLGWLGSQPAEGSLAGIPFVNLAQFGIVYYFGYFLAILPLLGKYEKTKPLPHSIHEVSKK